MEYNERMTISLTYGKLLSNNRYHNNEAFFKDLLIYFLMERQIQGEDREKILCLREEERKGYEESYTCKPLSRKIKIIKHLKMNQR